MPPFIHLLRPVCLRLENGVTVSGPARRSAAFRHAGVPRASLLVKLIGFADVQSVRADWARNRSSRLLKNAHLRRWPGRLGGVTGSRSLFVATSPLILRRCGRCVQVGLTPQDCLPKSAGERRSGGSRKRDFAKLNLHLPACRSLGAGRGIFEQPAENDFFSKLLVPFQPLLGVPAHP